MMNEWSNKSDVKSGRWAGVATDVAAKMKALERELRQANEILCQASAFLPQADIELSLGGVGDS